MFILFFIYILEFININKYTCYNNVYLINDRININIKHISIFLCLKLKIIK